MLSHLLLILLNSQIINGPNSLTSLQSELLNLLLEVLQFLLLLSQHCILCILINNRLVFDQFCPICILESL